MIGERIELWHKEEYHYPAAHGFIPIMVSYIHEDELMHPAMLVVPGGGYRLVSPSEAHLVAMEFYQAGYNVFVLEYTVNPLDEAPLKLQPLKDIRYWISKVVAPEQGEVEKKPEPKHSLTEKMKYLQEQKKQPEQKSPQDKQKKQNMEL